MRSTDERMLDVTFGSIRRLLVWATENQAEAIKQRMSEAAITYWDGYIRALNHVLDQENE